MMKDDEHHDDDSIADVGINRRVGDDELDHMHDVVILSNNYILQPTTTSPYTRKTKL